MIEPISTDRKIPKEKFRIINFSVGNGKTIEDLVHNEPPYFHFQVLRPESKDQADKAIEYFKAHNKIYICWASTMDMLLYLGCTETVYLKSKVEQIIRMKT